MANKPPYRQNDNKNGVQIIKQEKAVVSANRHHCLKHRPAEPFGGGAV